MKISGKSSILNRMVSVEIIVNVNTFLVSKVYMGHVTKVMAPSVNLFCQGNKCDMTLNLVLYLEVEVPRMGNLL